MKRFLQLFLKLLKNFPPIVFTAEARLLEDRLARCSCWKSFFVTRLLLQTSVLLMFSGQMPIVKVGRMAVQFAKPSSDAYEEKDGVKLPGYKGDDAFTEKERVPDPDIMIRAYCVAASPLNLLRAFAIGGYAATKIHSLKSSFCYEQ